MGGGDVGHVEGRVLPHQHDIDARQIGDGGIAQREVIALDRAHRKRARKRRHDAIAERQIARAVIEQIVAAALRLQRQRKGGIACDVDLLDRVHLDGNAHERILLVQPPLQAGEPDGGFVMQPIAGFGERQAGFIGLLRRPQRARRLVQPGQIDPQFRASPARSAPCAWRFPAPGPAGRISIAPQLQIVLKPEQDIGIADRFGKPWVGAKIASHAGRCAQPLAVDGCPAIERIDQRLAAVEIRSGAGSGRAYSALPPPIRRRARHGCRECRAPPAGRGGGRSPP